MNERTSGSRMSPSLMAYVQCGTEAAGGALSGAAAAVQAGDLLADVACNLAPKRHKTLFCGVGRRRGAAIAAAAVGGYKGFREVLATSESCREVHARHVPPPPPDACVSGAAAAIGSGVATPANASSAPGGAGCGSRDTWAAWRVPVSGPEAQRRAFEVAKEYAELTQARTFLAEVGLGRAPDATTDEFIAGWLLHRIGGWYTPSQMGDESALRGVLAGAVKHLSRNPYLTPVHPTWFTICPRAWRGDLTSPPV